MNNVVRTLVFNNQVSLTLIDTTNIVKAGIAFHGLCKTSALVFGKAISAMTFMSACLKNEAGEISLSVKSDGQCGDIAVSGNQKLFLRGYVADPFVETGDEAEAFGKNGSLTIIRDDGYRRPFVGSCAFPNIAGVDSAFEEYYAVSEQLPTRIATAVEFSDNGDCIFAGVVALQLLPYADDEALRQTGESDLDALLADIRGLGAEGCLKKNFTYSQEALETREAVYRCNCSREYLLGVLASLGEAQMRQIIQEDGAVKVHCHYCNTDYEFTDEDADGLFGK